MTTYQRYQVTLTFHIIAHGLPDGATPDSIAEELANNHWSDGRYPFDREMICEGVTRAFSDGVSRVAMAEARRDHGNEMIATGPNSETALAVLSHKERMSGFSLYMPDAIKEARVEAIEDCQD
jgi:hypothetical protein